jgi:hypothetical protein
VLTLWLALGLATNIRLGLKGLPRTNTSLFQKSVNNDRNFFYNTGPWYQYFKTFFMVNTPEK